MCEGCEGIVQAADAKLHNTLSPLAPHPSYLYYIYIFCEWEDEAGGCKVGGIKNVFWMARE